MENKIIEIEDIRCKKFLLFRGNSAFKRLVLSLVKATEVLDCEFNTTYDAVFQKTCSEQIVCKLVYLKKTQEWYIRANNDEKIQYKLIDCTDSLYKILDLNDIITCYDDAYYRYKVVQILEKYKSIIIKDLATDERHKLSKLKDRFQLKNIISITKQ